MLAPVHPAGTWDALKNLWSNGLSDLGHIDFGDGLPTTSSSFAPEVSPAPSTSASARLMADEDAFIDALCRTQYKKVENEYKFANKLLEKTDPEAAVDLYGRLCSLRRVNKLLRNTLTPEFIIKKIINDGYTVSLSAFATHSFLKEGSHSRTKDSLCGEAAEKFKAIPFIFQYLVATAPAPKKEGTLDERYPLRCLLERNDRGYNVFSYIIPTAHNEPMTPDRFAFLQLLIETIGREALTLNDLWEPLRQTIVRGDIEVVRLLLNQLDDEELIDALGPPTAPPGFEMLSFYEVAICNEHREVAELIKTTFDAARERHNATASATRADAGE